MNIELTEYYPEYLRYFTLASKQQDLCNLGTTKYKHSNVDDDLMHHVHLYDVVERKYAGFSQVLNDAFYGWTEDHPYWHKMQSGHLTLDRQIIANNWTGKHIDFDLPEWLYVFILHRVCGSGINYAKKTSGYHNTLFFNLHESKTIEEMTDVVNTYPDPFYTSGGYQFPAFPKPPAGSKYKRGGDYFLTEYAPKLARALAEFLQKGGRKDLREIGSFMLQWNSDNGLRQYHFQYAAVISDIADWYPQFVNKESSFYYGSNATECISYLATPIKKMSKIEFLDEVMEKIYEDTKAYPYNAEDVCCDFIRWVENYVRPGSDYDHLDFDTLWSSCKIKDHPFGRQKPMLDLGLIKTFKNMKSHPSDNAILKQAGLSVSEYKQKCAEASL